MGINTLNGGGPVGITNTNGISAPKDGSTPLDPDQFAALTPDQQGALAGDLDAGAQLSSGTDPMPDGLIKGLGKKVKPIVKKGSAPIKKAGKIIY